MISSPFTATDVYKLTPEQIENIILAYFRAIKHSAYGSGRANLSGTLGENIDLFDLEMVEDAARAMSDSVEFRQAITWAWLAYRYHRRVANIEREHLCRPWVERG